MQTLLIDIESETKAKELASMLNSMNFIKRVQKLKSTKSILEALKEHEELKISIVKNKNKAIAKYL
jgi:hypothetical protein